MRKSSLDITNTEDGTFTGRKVCSLIMEGNRKVGIVKALMYNGALLQFVRGV